MDVETPPALSPELATAVAGAAKLIGRDASTILGWIVKEGVDRILARAEPAPDLPLAVTVGEGRKEVEIRALRCLLCSRIEAYKDLMVDCDPAEQEALAREFSPDRFLMYEGVARALEEDRELTSAEGAGALLADLATPESGWLPPLARVLESMRPPAVIHVTTFNVRGYIPMVRSASFDGFGDASTIRLVAGFRDAGVGHVRELLAVEVAIPIPPEDIANQIRIDFSAGTYDVPHVARARTVFEHVLAVLQLHGTECRYEDHHGDLGIPHRSRIVETFADGSCRDSPAVHPGYVTLGTWHPSASIAATPLMLEPDAFSRSYESAATEIALLTGREAVRGIDSLRRALLVVESVVPEIAGTVTPAVEELPEGRAPARAKMRDPVRGGAGLEVDPAKVAFIERKARELLEKTASVTPEFSQLYSDMGTFVQDLVYVRNSLSHLTRDELDGDSLRKLPKAFGLEMYNGGDLFKRIQRVASPLMVLADQALLMKLRGAFEPRSFFRRKPGAAELLSLLQDDEYASSSTVRRVLLGHLAAHATAGGPAAPDTSFAARFVEDEDIDTANVAITCASASRAGVLTLLRRFNSVRADLRAQAIRAVVGRWGEDLGVLDVLEDELLSLGDDELLLVHAAAMGETGAQN